MIHTEEEKRAIDENPIPIEEVLTVAPDGAAEEPKPAFECRSCGLVAAEEEGEECGMCGGLRLQAEELTTDQITGLLREVSRLRDLAIGLGWGTKNSIGGWKVSNDPDEVDGRLYRVFHISAFRISRALNMTLDDCKDLQGDFCGVDLNACLVALAFELAKLDTLARANGVTKTRRRELLDAGKRMGYKDARGHYDWESINAANTNEAFKNSSSSRKKKGKKKSPKPPRPPRPLKRKGEIVEVKVEQAEGGDHGEG